MTNDSHEARDRALYKILINEGWPQEDVVSLIATGDSIRLDELLVKLMADPRRQHDLEIITPDQMSDGIVDLNAAKIQAASQRSEKEMEAESAHWEHVRDQLMNVMEASGLDPQALTSATLRALLEVLQDDATLLEEAKKRIALTLNAFH
jgi:hypothetical protein